MCKADVALLTFSWDKDDRAPKPNFVVEHECANWEKVDHWAKEHAFDIFDETTLVHPTLGKWTLIYSNCYRANHCFYRPIIPRGRI